MAETEALEMDEVLEKITFYCLEQARAKLEVGEELVPFTVVVEGEQMFEETHPGDDVLDCRANAQATVKSSSTFSTHYAFCYDGFLVTDQGQLDTIIVECAQRDMEQAYVIGLLYKVASDGVVEFEEQPAYIDDIETFYDREAVQYAEAEEAAAADSEMTEAQRALQQTLGFEGTSKDDGPATPAGE